MRLHARFICQFTMRATQPGSIQDKVVEGDLYNISAGGALCRIQGKMEIGPIKIEIPSEADVFTIAAKVVRDAGPDKKDASYHFYGLEFFKTRKAQEQVTVLLNQLRDGPRT